MKAFDYERPSDESAALQAGSRASSRYIAGGTLLVDLLRLNVEQPALVVDLNALSLGAIEVSASGLRIGALVKNSDLAEHPAVLADYPVLAQALLSGASAQIRNMASLGGNVLQRTRCAYFRDPAVAACNKRTPGSGCAAIAGFSRMHAVLGVSDHCIASHPSDLCVALLALDAEVHTRGAAGERTIAFADFHTVPGTRPHIESVLTPGEIVTAVSVPTSSFAHHSAYVKVRDRASFAFALASAAVALELDGNIVRGARVALGGVASKPWRCPEVERALLGKAANETSFRSAAALAMTDAAPTADNRFKVELGRRVIARALEEARSRP